jgi:hypothetical protein
MAESVVIKLEEMLPEAAYFIEKGVFSEKEMRSIMSERRVHELALASRSCALRDYLNYINHEIKTECERRERYESLKIQKLCPRDFTVVQRVHSLFTRCLSKFGHDVSVWQKYIEFCTSSGSSGSLSRALMRAIQRHPRVASFRIIAADRELQLGGLISARKLLMRAIRIKTDNQLLLWQQLFKLELSAIHKLVTSALSVDASSTEASAPTSQEESGKPARPVPTCQAAAVVYRHALRELSTHGKAGESFQVFARGAFETLEMSIIGFGAPKDLEVLQDLIRQ